MELRHQRVLIRRLESFLLLNYLLVLKRSDLFIAAELDLLVKKLVLVLLEILIVQCDHKHQEQVADDGRCVHNGEFIRNEFLNGGQTCVRKLGLRRSR